MIRISEKRKLLESNTNNNNKYSILHGSSSFEGSGPTCVYTLLRKYDKNFRRVKSDLLFLPFSIYFDVARRLMSAPFPRMPNQLCCAATRFLKRKQQQIITLESRARTLPSPNQSYPFDPIDWLQSVAKHFFFDIFSFSLAFREK